MKRFVAVLFIALIFLPVQSWGHGLHGNGFVSGITHSILGLDHFAAILGICMVGYFLMYEKHYLLSVLFIIAMIVGGLLGMDAKPLPSTEWVIVGSVITVGMMLATKLEFTLVGFALFAIVFGFFHGHAHGTEMANENNKYLYILGYTLAASSISFLGIGIHKYVKNPVHIRILGGFLTGIGAMLLHGLLSS